MKNSISTQTFLVKVLSSPKFPKMFCLQLVNDNKFLPRTFINNLPAGTKSGDIMYLTGRLYTNASGYDAIYIDNAKPA